LQNPAAPTALYATADLDLWINQARGQVAAEAECVRTIGTVSTVSSQRPYDFTSINIGVAATTGRAGVIKIDSILYTSGSGQKWITPRAWNWFQLYSMNNIAPTNAAPTSWAQYRQGAGYASNTPTTASGSFYLDPPPDTTYTLNCDCACYPIDLVDDTTVEAIPFLWTDAVAFFAAYFALLSAQNNARMADAERYFNMYKMFMDRARAAANPSVNRWMYSQGGDPIQVAKIQSAKGAG
jgi:hypothetical protein